MPILRTIASDIAGRLAEYESAECTDERRLELENELLELDLDIEEKAKSYQELISYKEDEIARLKKEEERLAKWRKQEERSKAWLEENLERQLLLANKRRFTAGFWRFAPRRGESMVVTNETVIPAEYLTPVPATTTPDNAKIKAALQERFNEDDDWYGEFTSPEIPGAKLIVKQNIKAR